MKVLVQCYDTAFQNKAGGVHSRIVRTVEYLREEGVQIDYFDKFRTDVTKYDILHIFKLDISNYGLMQYAKSKGIKTVLASIVVLNKPFVIDFYWKIRKIPIMTTYKILFRMCEISDIIVAETQKEAKFISKHYHVSMDKIQVIPNGADIIESESELIYEMIGKKCSYVLQVARFDENKNQLNVIRAIRNTNIEMVFIGGADFNCADYYEKCLKEADGAENIHFLGWQDRNSELLKSAYSNASTVIVPSYQETFGLAIVEGIMAGANLVVSKTLPILEHPVFHDCIQCEPSNTEDIKTKIVQAMEKEVNETLMVRVKDQFSWKSVAVSHKKMYERLV